MLIGLECVDAGEWAKGRDEVDGDLDAENNGNKGTRRILLITG
jgi:hypothetical protein